MQYNLRLAALCCGIFVVTALGNVKKPEDSFLEQVQADFLASYGPAEEQTKPQAEEKASKIREFFLGKRFKAPVVELSKRRKCELLLQAAPLTKQGNGQCVDFTSLRKLEFFCGGEDRSENLVKRVGKHLATQNGACHMVSMLAQPTTDVKTLTARRDAIHALAKNKKLLKNCTDACTMMAKSEEAFLNFFLPANPDTEEMSKHVYFGKVLNRVFDNGNQSSLALELRSQLKNAQDILSFAPVTVFCTVYGYLKAASKAHRGAARGMNAAGGPAHLAARLAAMAFDPRSPGRHARAIFEEFSKNVRSFVTETMRDDIGIDPADLSEEQRAQIDREIESHMRHAERELNEVLETLEGSKGFQRSRYGLQLFALWNGYRTFMNLKFRTDIIKHLQGKMIGVANYLRGMKDLQDIAENNPALRKLPSFAQLEELVAPTGKHSAKFENLLHKLDTWTFSGSPSVLSLSGRVLAAHELMKEVRDEFADALHAAGEFEACVAIAQLVNEHNKIEARYCFVDFVEDTPVPTIEAHGLWNPFVDPRKVVTNDITFGDNGLRGMILTGPNTGGKSTIIKGLMTNLLLAQTFGIAAAEQMSLSPFSRFHCHLNIADDTAGGVSLFKAEVLRARELINSLQTLPYDERAFVIVDEIFTATSPDQAAKLSYDFIKKVAGFRNCAFIDATHFKNVTELANENKACRNYHMDAITYGNGTVERYTYKLKEGISQVQNAAQVAHEAGALETVFG